MTAPESAGDATAFVLRLGESMARFGAAATRVEQVMGLCADRLGLEGQFFGTPTSIFAAFGSPGRQTVGLLRTEPGSVDLGKRSSLDELVGDVLHGRIGPTEGLARLDRIAREPARYGAVLTTVCYGLGSAAAARFLGGGAREIAAAAVVGLATGLLAIRAGSSPVLSRLFEPAAAMLASALAVVAAARFGPLSTYVVTVSGIIVLLPGLTVTTALSELAARHLVAGATRFLGGMMSLLFLGLGVAIGHRLVDLLPAMAPRSGVALGLPAWTLGLALIAAPVSFGVLLRARARDFGWITLMGAAAFVGARAGEAILGPELGAFFGALVVGAGSNLYNRFLRRPAVVTLVPGLLVLVPGAIGFRSFSSLIERDVISGIDTAFTMLLVAISLVAGLLVANVLVPAPGPAVRAS